MKRFFLFLWILSAAGVCQPQNSAGNSRPAEDPLLQPTPGPDGQIPPADKNPPVFKWDAGVGYAAYLPPMKRGCWYPVWVKVEAVTAAVRGEAVLTQPEYPIEVRIPFSVEKGAVKLYRSYYKLTPFSGYETHAALQAEIRVKRQPPQTIPLDYRVAHMNAQRGRDNQESEGLIAKDTTSSTNLSQVHSPKDKLCVT